VRTRFQRLFVNKNIKVASEMSCRPLQHDHVSNTWSVAHVFLFFSSVLFWNRLVILDVLEHVMLLSI
jgi:hypothetical protein